MKFGSIPLAEADGAILAHSQRVGERKLKKGHVLSAKDLADLAEAGYAAVVAARLEPSDIGDAGTEFLGGRQQFGEDAGAEFLAADSGCLGAHVHRRDDSRASAAHRHRDRSKPNLEFFIDQRKAKTPRFGNGLLEFPFRSDRLRRVRSQLDSL